MPIIAPIPRDARGLMQKAIHKTRDKNHAGKLTAILMLQRGSGSAMSPDHSFAPVHLLSARLTDSHYRVQKA